MTLEECLVVTAYTKVLMAPIDKFHAYAEDMLGRPVLTHEMAGDDFWVELKDMVRPRFLELCWKE